jgi:hypothetical protein
VARESLSASASLRPRNAYRCGAGDHSSFDLKAVSAAKQLCKCRDSKSSRHASKHEHDETRITFYHCLITDSFR